MYLGGAYFYACAPSKLRRVRQLVPDDPVAAVVLVNGRIGPQCFESQTSSAPRRPMGPWFTRDTVFLVLEANTFEVADEQFRYGRCVPQ